VRIQNTDPVWDRGGLQIKGYVGPEKSSDDGPAPLYSGPIIGRDTTPELGLDTMASRRHFSIQVAGSHPNASVFVEDLRSVNGTIVYAPHEAIVANHAEVIDSDSRL
jgi:hypothetical protein